LFDEGVKIFILKNCWNRFLVRNVLPASLPNVWWNPVRKSAKC